MPGCSDDARLYRRPVVLPREGQDARISGHNRPDPDGIRSRYLHGRISGKTRQSENQHIMEQNEEREEELLPEPPSSDTATEIQKLIEERDSPQDRLLRRQAEFENYKKRVERERGEQIQNASAELIRELLG